MAFLPVRKIGDTTIKIDGKITELIGFNGIDTRIEIAGRSMDELYWIIGGDQSAKRQAEGKRHHGELESR